MPNQRAYTIAKITVAGGYMSMVFQSEFTVINDNLLIMKYWSICTPCTEVNNLPPCHTIHIEIQPVRGFTMSP